jgi:sugar/nucleoside kinase (ribokinase family)
MHDVYAYGVIAASTLVELADPFPDESGYAEIREVHRSLGGEAAGGAYVLARLGIPTKLSGSELGNDHAAQWTVDRLAGAGVDCSEIALIDAGGVTELVVSSLEGRTVFATYGRMLDEAGWSAPRREDVRSSRVVCLDPFLGEESRQVAQWCREDGIPYVTVDVEPESEIARGAEAVVVAEEYADRTFGDYDPVDLVDRYAETCPGLVVLTRGGLPAWYRRRETEARPSAPFEVEVVDTTGAGDSFRAGIIYGLLRGEPDDVCVEIAGAVAAMVCSTSPGVLNSPTAAELETFRKTRQHAR